MAQTIKLKRSATQGNIPTTAQLELGEVAVNTYDGLVFIKKDNGTESIIQLNPTSLSDLTNDMWEVTSTVPTDGSGKPTGYVWYIV